MRCNASAQEMHAIVIFSGVDIYMLKVVVLCGFKLNVELEQHKGT